MGVRLSHPDEVSGIRPHRAQLRQYLQVVVELAEWKLVELHPELRNSS